MIQKIELLWTCSANENEKVKVSDVKFGGEWEAWACAAGCKVAVVQAPLQRYCLARTPYPPLFNNSQVTHNTHTRDLHMWYCVLSGSTTRNYRECIARSASGSVSDVTGRVQPRHPCPHRSAPDSAPAPRLGPHDQPAIKTCCGSANAASQLAWLQG